MFKSLKLLQRSFFGPSGGKSDVLIPFLMVPKSSFDLFGKIIFEASSCLGGNREAKSIVYSANLGRKNRPEDATLTKNQPKDAKVNPKHPKVNPKYPKVAPKRLQVDN